jgi:hypothetical protein
MKRILFVTHIVFLLVTSVNHAEDLSLTASVDRAKIGTEDQLTLTISASGSGFESLPEPELPALDNFEVIGTNQSSSSQFSIVNGKVSSSKTIDFIYSLVPLKPGTWKIGSAKLKHRGKTYATEPIHVEIVAGTVQETRQPRSRTRPAQPTREVDLKDNLFVKAIVDKEEAYVGEQITVSYELYKRIGLSDVNYQKIPSFTNFWVESLFDAKQLNFRSEVVNGIRYDVAPLKRLALFPTTDGTFSIEPLSLSCQVSVRGHDIFDSFFGRSKPVTIQTEPITVTVLPLPPDAPPGFRGAVGAYSMSASVDKTQVEANQPVTLTVRISGAGNIKTLPDPMLPPLEDFKKFDSGSNEKITSTQEILKGTKTYTYVLIPKTEGKYTVSPAVFTFFDPQAKSYKTVKTRPFVLLATPGEAEERPVAYGLSQSEIEVVGKDIRYIKPNMAGLENHERFLYQSRWFQLSQFLPLFAVVVALFYRRHSDRVSQDVGYARLRRAHRRAQRRLKEADGLIENESPEKFYACVSKAITDYVGDKLNISAAGITTDQLAQELEEKGISEKVRGRLLLCLNECDFARFAPSGRSKNDIRQVLDSARSVIRMMEKEKV